LWGKTVAEYVKVEESLKKKKDRGLLAKLCEGEARKG